MEERVDWGYGLGFIGSLQRLAENKRKSNQLLRPSGQVMRWECHN